MDKIRVLIVDDHAVVRRGLRSMLDNAPAIQVVGEAADGAEALEQVVAWQPEVVLLDVRMPGMSGIEVTRRLRQEYPSVKILILTAYAEDEYLFPALQAGAHGYLLKTIQYADLVAAIKNVGRGSRLLEPTLVGRVLEQFERLAGTPREGPARRVLTAAPIAPDALAAAAFRRRFDKKRGAGSWDRLAARYNSGVTLAELAQEFGGVTKQAVRWWLQQGGIEVHAAGWRAAAVLPDGEEAPGELSPREQEVLQAITEGASNQEVALALGISVNTVKRHLTSIFQKLGVASRREAAMVVVNQGIGDRGISR
jgi:DNA-binding NarL/FixJ family response regulator